MRGVRVATNGILVAILVDDAIIFGHADWWVTDKDDADSPSKRTASEARAKVLAEYR